MTRSVPVMVTGKVTVQRGFGGASGVSVGEEVGHVGVSQRLCEGVQLSRLRLFAARGAERKGIDRRVSTVCTGAVGDRL
eukprot:1320242-Rhodomonas_salina.1